MKAPREADVLKACLSLLALRRVYCWRQNQGAIPLPNGKGFRRFVGLRGVADILGFVEGSKLREPVRHAVILAVEVKKPGGRLRPEQSSFLESVRQAGGFAVCVSSVKELEKYLSDIGYA